jgi:hypothetical protein
VSDDRDIAESAFLVGKCRAKDCQDLAAVQRLEGEDAAAAQERRVDGKERVLRGGADQDDPAFLDVRQEYVLLRPVEAVKLVDEQDRPPAGVLQLAPSFLEQLADFFHTCGDGVERDEAAAGVLGDDVGQGRLAGAGRAVKDQ